MAKHFGHRRKIFSVAAGGLGIAVLAAGGVALALRSQPSSAAGIHSGGHQAPTTTTTVAPKPPLQVTATTPATGAKGVDGTAPLVITTSAPVNPADGVPTISPAVPGNWTVSGDQLQFAPTGAFTPSTTYTVTIPPTLQSAGGSVLGAARTLSWTTGVGSVLRLQQLLAQLGYLPLSWTATPGQPAPASAAAAVWHPPTGTFTWTWSSPPPTLAAAWVPGQYTVMTQGAVMAFESDHGMATDGITGAKVWTALLAATTSASPPVNQHGYTYALAQNAYRAGPLAVSLPLLDMGEPLTGSVIAIAAFGESLGHFSPVTLAVFVAGVACIGSGVALLDRSPLVQAAQAAQTARAEQSTVNCY